MYVPSVQILMRETRQTQTGSCSDNTVDGPASSFQETSDSSISNSNDIHILWIKTVSFRNVIGLHDGSLSKTPNLRIARCAVNFDVDIFNGFDIIGHCL